MAKTEQKTGRNSGQTVNILLAVICIVLCALSIYFYRACDSLNTAVLSDDAELSELLAIYDEKSAELAEVTETREPSTILTARSQRSRKSTLRMR